MCPERDQNFEDFIEWETLGWELLFQIESSFRGFVGKKEERGREAMVENIRENEKRAQRQKLPREHILIH